MLSVKKSYKSERENLHFKNHTDRHLSFLWEESSKFTERANHEYYQGIKNIQGEIEENLSSIKYKITRED